MSINEIDPIDPSQNELTKMKVTFVKMSEKCSSQTQKEYYMVSGKVEFLQEISFPTYDGQRMAMAFAPLAMLHPIQIEEPDVVNKSYPQFWDDLKKIGL